MVAKIVPKYFQIVPVQNVPVQIVPVQIVVVQNVPVQIVPVQNVPVKIFRSFDYGNHTSLQLLEKYVCISLLCTERSSDL